MESNRPYNLLVFVTEFPVNTETFIERELAKLAERGQFALQICSLKQNQGYLSDNLKDRVKYINLKSPTFLMKCLLDTVAWLPSNTSLLLKTYNWFVDEPSQNDHPPSRIQKLYVVLKAAVVYRYLLKVYKADTALVHFMSHPSTVIMIASQLSGVPFGISAHARDIFEYGEYYYAKYQTSSFITICNVNAYNYVAKKILAIDPQADLASLIHNLHGIDLPKFKDMASRAPAQRRDKPVLMCNARFVEKKGHTYLLNASKILRDRGLDHYMYFIGSGGDQLANIKHLIDALSLQSVVTIPNDGKGMPFTDLLPYYKQSDYLVFPGIDTETGDFDGIPNVLFEGALLGLPIVSTNSGSISDFVVDGVTGVIVPQRDPVALADAIIKLHQDLELRTRLADNAYASAVSKFDLDANIQRLEALLLSSVQVTENSSGERP